MAAGKNKVELKEYYETRGRHRATANTYDPITTCTPVTSNYGNIYMPINNRTAPRLNCCRREPSCC